MAAISTVSSSSRRLSTVPSMPNSPRRPARNARPTSPCSSSVIPSAMSTVSFASVLRCGAFSADGLAPEPFLEPSRRRHAGGRRLAAIAPAAGRTAGAAARTPAVVPVPGPVSAPAAAGLAPTSARRAARRPSSRPPRTAASALATALAALLAPSLARSAAAAAPGSLPSRPGPDWTDPCPHPGLDPHAAEEPGLGLAHHDHLGIADGHSQLVQGAARSPPRRSSPPPQPTPRAIEPFLSASSATADGPWAPAVLDVVVARRLAVRRLASRGRLPAVGVAPGRSSWRRWSSPRSWPAAGSPWPPPCRRWRVDVFLTALGGGGFSSLSPFPSAAEPISRSAATGVTMPLRNITSCVPIRMADETTM